MLTVVLWVVGEDRSRHSPNSMEAANITTVVTMATSRLSRTLEKGRDQINFCNYMLKIKLVSHFQIFAFKSKYIISESYYIWLTDVMICWRWNVPWVNRWSSNHLINLALGWMCLMRYLARLLFMQLKSAPSRPPTTPIRTKKARSTAVHRWQFLSPSGHWWARSFAIGLNWYITVLICYIRQTMINTQLWSLSPQVQCLVLDSGNRRLRSRGRRLQEGRWHWSRG